MDITKAIDCIIDGNALLLTGLGFSVNAYKDREKKQKLLGTEELMDLFYNLANEQEERVSLADAVNCYNFNNKKVKQVVQNLQAEYLVKSYDEYYKDILELPWKRIYTTNYDNLVEIVSNDIDYFKENPRKSFIVTDNIKDFRKGDILHINGYAANLDENNYNTTIKLSGSDYIKYCFKENPWHKHFKNDVLTSLAIFIIGSSNSDLEIAQLLVKSPDIKSKCHIISSPKPSKYITRQFQDTGQISFIGVKRFAEIIREEKQHYTPSTRTFYYNSFEKYDISTTTETVDIDIEDRRNLLVKGRYDKEMHISSLLSNNKLYIIERSETKRICHSILNHGLKRILINGVIGSGKTIICKSLALELSKHSYDVFYYAYDCGTVQNELNNIFLNEKPALFIIDDYASNIELLEQIDEMTREQDIIIIAERTEVSDSRIHTLPCHFTSFDVTKLSIDDESAFIHFIEKSALWGERAKWTSEKKLEHVRVKLQSRLSNILIDIFEANQISNELINGYKHVSDDSDLRNIIITFFIFAILRQPINNETIAEYINNIPLDIEQLTKNKYAQYFLNIKNGNLQPSSAIFVRHVVAKFEDAEYIIKKLQDIFRHAYHHYDSWVKDDYNALIKDLTLSSTVSLLLPNNTPAKIFMKYYDTLDEYYRDNKLAYMRPLFWLHYSITLMQLQRYETAYNTFKTAYAEAEKVKGFQKYQIDNHYARFILEYILYQKNNELAEKNLLKAHDFIMRQILDKTRDHRHYPFLRAKQYSDYCEFFKDYISAETVTKVMNDVLKSIQLLEEKDFYLHKDSRILECKTKLENYCILNSIKKTY